MSEEKVEAKAEVEETMTEEATLPENEAEETEEKELTIEEQLETARAEAAHNLDGWLRAQAEFANARKRFEKQRSEIYVGAKVDMVAKLLPVLDDFERAIESVPEEIANHSWFEGMELVHRKMKGILDSYNVETIEAVGQPFDPNFHEAIMQEDTDEYESGVVSRELQKGYKVGDRVIRPSLVYVAA